MVKKYNILSRFEKIFWLSKEILEELKRDKRWSQCGNKSGQIKVNC